MSPAIISPAIAVQDAANFLPLPSMQAVASRRQGDGQENPKGTSNTTGTLSVQSLSPPLRECLIVPNGPA